MGTLYRAREAEITEDLALARAARRRLPMFGGDSHGYELGAPLPEAEVAAFEAAHGVTLPAAYRWFITTVGHGGPGRFGGAGPHYGLLPLTDWDQVLWEGARPGVLAEPLRAEADRDYDDWWAQAGLADGDEPYTGCLALGQQGCGYVSFLVVSGPARGRVGYTRDGDQAPLFPPDPDFLSWYRRWLTAALAGARGF
jgi:hypothetical protein